MSDDRDNVRRRIRVGGEVSDDRHPGENFSGFISTGTGRSALYGCRAEGYGNNFSSQRGALVRCVTA